MLLPLSHSRNGRLFLSRNVAKHGGFKNCLEYLSGAFGYTERPDKMAAQYSAQLNKGYSNFALRAQALRAQELIRRLNLTIILLGDSDFPVNLGNIPDPPIALFVKASATHPAELTAAAMAGEALRIAIVGSRRALTSSRIFAEHLALRLAEKGFEIVSGLAVGIDTAAHEGALASRKSSLLGGITLAVLGSGHDRIYPRSNTQLYRRILDGGGLVVSEYLPTVPAWKQNFPARNRIVSGLSNSVIVVEATGRSGSLITARLALEQGRDVMAVPGVAQDPRFAGCHRLIKQGAALVDCVEDVLQSLDLQGLCSPGNDAQANDDNGRENSQLMATLTEPEVNLLGCIEYQLTGLDSLVNASGKSIPALMEILLKLEMKGLIRSCNGGYVRAN